MLAKKPQATKIHLRHCTLFWYDAGVGAAEARQRICSVYGEDVLSLKTVKRWFSKFSSGNREVEDKPRPGRPLGVDVEAPAAEVEENNQRTTRQLKEALPCSQATIVRGLHRMGYASLVGRFVPHDLTQAGKGRRVECSTELLGKRRTLAWLKHLITVHESWVLYATPKRSRYWVQAGAAAPAMAKPDRHQKKLLLCVWWSVRGIEHWELLEEEDTVTAKINVRQLATLKEKLDQDSYWKSKIFFQHDNARPHVANATQSFLKTSGWEVICHPPYSTELAPSDYHLFRSLKNHLSGKNFTNREQVVAALSDFFQSKPASFYSDGIMDLPRRWRKVLLSNGEYIND